jgi:hypothetical protein
MSRIIGAVAAIAAIVAAIIAWSNFMVVKQEAAAAATKAAGREGSSIISPFDMMLKYDTIIPLEDWRPAN